MAQGKLTRAWIEAAVDKAIRDIQSNPKRSIRNLVEFAMNATTGDFQKHFLSVTRHMLDNPQSAYYRLMMRSVQEIEHRRLKAFGINIGLNGCVNGTEQLRASQAREGTAFPWMLCANLHEKSLHWPSLLSRLLQQGTQLGTHLYLFSGEEAVCTSMLQLYEQYSNCAFILLLPAESISQTLISRLDHLSHVLLCISSQQKNVMKESSSMLRKARMLYGCYSQINPNDVLYSMGEDHLTALEEWGGMFFVVWPQAGTLPQAAHALQCRVVEIRKSQQHAFYIFNLDADVDVIDHAISGKKTSVCVIGQNSLWIAGHRYEGKNFDLYTHSLTEVLQSASSITP